MREEIIRQANKPQRSCRKQSRKRRTRSDHNHQMIPPLLKTEQEGQDQVISL